MKLNNKGFTLVEVLAVVVILGVLSTIMITSVGSMINKNKEDNLNNLKKSILSAAKVYISDHRYDIELDSTTSCDSNKTRNIKSIENKGITNNQLKIKYLINDNNLKDNIKNPINNKILDTQNSYIYIEYNCETRDYIYGSCFNDEEECSPEEKSNQLIWN